MLQKYLAFQLNWWQAVIFYVVGMTLTVAISFGIVYAHLYLTHTEIIEKKVLQIRLTAIVFVISTLVAWLLVEAKGIYNRKTIGCLVAAAALSVPGAIFSYLPIAYLTTLPKKV